MRTWLPWSLSVAVIVCTIGYGYWDENIKEPPSNFTIVTHQDEFDSNSARQIPGGVELLLHDGDVVSIPAAAIDHVIFRNGRRSFK